MEEKYYEFRHWGMNKHSAKWTKDYIVDLQKSFYHEKPQKFLGGYWSPTAKRLYGLLDEEDRVEVDKKISLIGSDRESIKINDELDCPKCGYKMVEKDGKYGLFYSCSQFPSCWSSMPHPDNPNPKFEKKPEPIEKSDMVVSNYYSYHTKFNGKKVKSGTPTTHEVSFEGDHKNYIIKTHGGRQHLYVGDKCNFSCKKNWEGDYVINRKTLTAWDRKGNQIPGKYRNRG